MNERYLIIKNLGVYFSRRIINSIELELFALPMYYSMFYVFIFCEFLQNEALF